MGDKPGNYSHSNTIRDGYLCCFWYVEEEYLLWSKCTPCVYTRIAQQWPLKVIPLLPDKMGDCIEPVHISQSHFVVVKPLHGSTLSRPELTEESLKHRLSQSCNTIIFVKCACYINTNELGWRAKTVKLSSWRGMARGSHTCKILRAGCGQEQHYATEISDGKLPWTKVQ